MKTYLKNQLPSLLVEFILAKRKLNGKSQRSTKEIFTDYKTNRYWNSSESVSGEGSEILVTETLRDSLKELFEAYNIKSILDLPCGDFNWMKEVDLKDMNYIGGDIVKSLIIENNESYSNENIKFLELDIIKDSLPKVDLIFCRDCLVHLSYKEIVKSLVNIKKSESKYILMTNFTRDTVNRDILTGQWRKINFQLKPFNFIKPLDSIDEKYMAKGFAKSDKSLALWKVDDIRIPYAMKLYANFI